jgi:hypothetical protein
MAYGSFFFFFGFDRNRDYYKNRCAEAKLGHKLITNMTRVLVLSQKKQRVITIVNSDWLPCIYYQIHIYRPRYNFYFVLFSV